MQPEQFMPLLGMGMILLIIGSLVLNQFGLLRERSGRTPAWEVLIAGGVILAMAILGEMPWLVLPALVGTVVVLISR
jgi:hypothetical protein